MSSAATKLVWRLNITCEQRDGIAVFAAAGRLGTLSSGMLIETLVQAIADGKHRLVLDLAAVDYISSAGLLALEAVTGRLCAAGGELVLCGLSESVRLALDLAGLTAEHACEPTRDAAVIRLSFGASASPPLP